MELSLDQFAKCMDMPPSTIERWIRQGRMPVKRKGDNCIFSQQALEKWAEEHNLAFCKPGVEQTQPAEEGPQGLLPVMKRGGICYDVPGDSVAEALRAAVDRMKAPAGEKEKQRLYENLLDREQMMSTGIGNGVAIPHPRTPLAEAEVPAQIATCFLEKPVDFSAVDKKPVFVLFVLVAPTSQCHLHLLSRISFCLRDAHFLEMLAEKPDPERLLEKAGEFDQRLDEPGG
ncbi:MAG: PTS sugar transporter subunit IIA [Thermodesulfobacteriota bacterium]